MNGFREATLLQTVDLLLDARRSRKPLSGLPAELTPADVSEAYLVQDRLADAFGAIGGWKIGAADPQAEPTFAPMPQAWIAPTNALLTGEHWRYRGLEAEVAFQVGRDLPPRPNAAYTRDEVLRAMASCHPAIEVLETAFAHPAEVDRASVIADLALHGGFIYGPPVADWGSIDFAKEAVSLAVDGVVRVQRTGSNPAGDLVRLLVWLANEGAPRTGGLRAGQWVTTGSWTGNTPADTTSAVTAEFSTVGRVNLRFA